MSMYRQLWLAIIISTLLALIGTLLASTLSARSYLQAQLTMKNADNAAALALSLSQQQSDLVVVELAVSALFDSGHYESIIVKSPEGNTVISRSGIIPSAEVPNWFMQLLPISALPGTAQISSGWQQLGTVVLKSNSSFAYAALWQSVVEMALAELLAGVVGGFLGSLILRRLRRPLQTVIDQAQAITDRRFVTIEEPAVPELQQLGMAMNAMVGRLKAMFEEQARQLETVRQEANCDPLTGLANRSFFMARLHSALEREDSAGGALLIIRVADLVGINHRLGRAATDDLLRRVGVVASYCVETHGDGTAARLNGADFAILLPGRVRLREIAEQLLARLIQETAAFVENGPAVWLGIGAFPPGLELGAVLAQVDAALAAAEADGITGIREAILAANDAPQSAEEWSRQIRSALDQRRVRLISFPVVNIGGRLMHRECPLRLKLSDQGDWLPAGQFLPMAERLKLTALLDLSAIELGLAELAKDAALSGLAINLSASSLENVMFLPRLVELLKQNAAASKRLWIEVAEAGALRYFDAFKTLVRAVKANGSRIGIEHFGRQFSQVGRFHDLGLDYLKVDVSFVRDLHNNPGNQTFLKGLTHIAHSISIMVIAEGVASDAELQALKRVDFDGATGPAIK
jgi:predicted signal transduction protein with EAL and GGDEF domain